MGTIMKWLIKIIFLLVIFVTPNVVFAQTTLAILSVDRNEPCNSYYIFDNASSVIAQDVTNRFNISKLYKAINISADKNIFKNTNVIKNGYKDVGLINFQELNNRNKNFHADYMLLITGSIDIQSHLFDNTVLNFLNVPGVDVISPKYVLYTFATFINPENNRIIWQKIYENKISANKFDILNPMIAPNYVQLKEIKKISRQIAKDIVLNVNFCLNINTDKVSKQVYSEIIEYSEELETEHDLNKSEGILPKSKHFIQSIKKLKK